MPKQSGGGRTVTSRLTSELHCPGEMSLDGEIRPGFELWTVRAGETLLPRFLPLLSAAERERASAFVHDADRWAYAAAHGLLRLALAQWLERSPDQLVFESGPNGKPRLVEGDIEFNLSHTRGLAACVFHPSLPVGVDVEPFSRAAVLESIRGEFLSPVELADPAPRYVEWWTAKEAILKASGQGLGADLRQVDAAGAGEWAVFPIRIGEEFCCSVAAPAAARRPPRWIQFQ